MLEIIIGTFFALLAIIGIVEIWRAAQGAFLMPRDARTTFMIVSEGHDEEIEYHVRSLMFKASELGLKSPLVVIVDMGMDDETISICRMLERESSCVRICKSQELPGLIGGEV